MPTMSFGFSISDAIVLTQLVSRVVENSRKACGAYDELTSELKSLRLVLRRLKDEVARAESPVNRPDDSCQKELQYLVAGCQKVLEVLEKILLKYNSLNQEERSVRKLWQRIRFGNGEVQSLTELRTNLVYYTSAISLFLNMVSVGSIGRVERQMNEAGDDLQEIKVAVNGITAHLLASKDHEGSILTTYADDDKAVWRQFRRELRAEGFSSSVIREHGRVIKAYIKELADRGLLDEGDQGPLNTSNDDEESSAVLSSDSSMVRAEIEENPRFEASDVDNTVPLGIESPAQDTHAELTCDIVSSGLEDDNTTDVRSYPRRVGHQYRHDALNGEPPVWDLHDKGEVNSFFNRSQNISDTPAYLFIATPYGICMMAYSGAARAYNLSLTCWQFCWRIEKIEECLAAPYVDQVPYHESLPNGSKVPSSIIQDIESLRDYSTCINKMHPLPLVVPSCPVGFHRSFLDNVLHAVQQHPPHWKDIFALAMLDQITEWIHGYETDVSNTLARVRQWSDLVKMETEALCLAADIECNTRVSGHTE